MGGDGFARKLVRFTQALRRAGLVIGLEQAECCAHSFQWIDATSKSEVYHAMRATLVSRMEDFATFDLVFERFFGERDAQAAARPQKTPMAPRHDPKEFQRTALVSFVAEQAKEADEEIEVADRTDTASRNDVLHQKDFSALSEAEARALELAMRSIRWHVAERRTRRRIRAQRGPELDLRRIVKKGARAGGKVLMLYRRAKKVKPRPLVLIADISGSMELYARLVLQFFHGVSRNHPLTETFVFGTRLTRITPALALENVDRALERAGAEIFDFAGGTRIGDCLARFNRTWGRRVLRRGAVVVIISDGCDTGDPEVLGREMERLHGHVHRLIWLNPRLGSAEYRPLAGGMAAALMHVDDFLPIHNLQSLHALADHLSQLPARR